jgi:hypothetical protein
MDDRVRLRSPKPSVRALAIFSETTDAARLDADSPVKAAERALLMVMA